ncbi:MAG: Guanosine-5'-triphosphate,3'-diphosphate pyrophosphatase [Nitrospirae bacterium]|nr:MAG: putative exopolyphosphatase [Nitrospira sp. OLB3]MBV6469700.1 Guanosine-5'-triphosphate,3'-diphosphate pyrophosphatase [Nitrospirota bacterium]MEB2338707.1 hypothetical protein [Nitrospirales bacterium]
MTVGSSSAPLILAGIDIGTLTCRLLIAERQPSGGLRELRSDRRILHLGQGVDRNRVIRPDAMQRVIATLQEWRHAINEHHVSATAVVATSAVRDAYNREEFLGFVRQEVGFDVEIISGEEEARRTLLGIRSGLPPGVNDMLALDIGGGSTEFILDRPAHSPLVRSIDVGVVRLSERLLHHDPPTGDEVAQARDWVRSETAAALADIPRREGLTFVGTAGTITALAAMAQQLPTYEPARIHNYILTLETVTGLEQQLLSRSKAQRQGLPGLERGREEVIVAGAIILRTVMETLGTAKVLVSDLGLREGVLIDLAERMKSSRTNKTQVIQNWITSGIKDFYISFEFESARKWPEYSTFFCYQGLEKICKAYILARSASVWEHLPEDRRSKRINKIAKDLGHDLEKLLSCLRSRGVLPIAPPKQDRGHGQNKKFEPYSEDELIRILKAAYIEARYPVPRNDKIHTKFPRSENRRPEDGRRFSHPLKETAPIQYARKTALAIVKKIEEDFSIECRRDKETFSYKISNESWERFQRVFFRLESSGRPC